MGLLDQFQANSPQGQAPQPGQIGLTQRPKQRFIDKVLMRQRDQKTTEAATSVLGENKGAADAGAMRARQMGLGTGANLFGMGGTLFGGQ